ncbi:MAG: sigma-54 dependent transcriptional regulator [Proteobacteria bacterium]|nr:sigma-54 dependent transcriptional regulator [Pseudomonadota bacterium]
MSKLYKPEEIEEQRNLTREKPILVVDDEPGIRESICKILQKEGYHAITASDGEEGIGILQKNDISLVLTDLKMPKVDGVKLLKTAKAISQEIEVIMITGHGNVEITADLMHYGGLFYLLQKPVDKKMVVDIVREALEKPALRRVIKRLKTSHREGNIIGTSQAMRKVLDLVSQVASSSANILITGESGVGKEVIAQAIHDQSPRKDKPFIKISCAALPETLLEAELFGYERGAFTGAIARREGRFELAHGGTLFLDEVGDINPAIQVKLLRVLQSGEFERLGGGKTFKADARLIAATNTSLKELVDKKKFREDLYYRLNVINIHIPPLRERKEDIPLLANHFLQIYSTKNDKKIDGISKEALDILLKYHWQGNVRELENTIERAVVLTRESFISPADIPDEIVRTVEENRTTPIEERVLNIPIGKIPLREIERMVLEETLKQSKGDKNIASKLLGISTRTIYRRIDEEGEDNQ